LKSFNHRILAKKSLYQKDEIDLIDAVNVLQQNIKAHYTICFPYVKDQMC